MNRFAYANGAPLMYTDPKGLFGWTDMPSLPQGVVDASAGFGDGISFGITSLIRDANGTNGSVNKCSGSYSGSHLAGTVATAALGLGRLAYAGGAAAIPTLASASEGAVAQALQASAMRNTLKGIFRGDWARSSTFRMYNPAELLATKYNGDAAEMLAAAARSNSYINALGATALGASIANEVNSQCGCP